MLSLPLPHRGIACMSGCKTQRSQFRHRDPSACGFVRHFTSCRGQHGRGLVTTAAATQTERSVGSSIDQPPSDGRHTGVANETQGRGRGVRNASELQIDLAECKKLAEQTSERVFEAGVVSSAEVRVQLVQHVARQYDSTLSGL